MSCLYNDEDIALLDFELPDASKYITKQYWLKIVPETELLSFFFTLESKINNVIFYDSNNKFSVTKREKDFPMIVDFISMLNGYNIEYVTIENMLQDVSIRCAKVKGDNIIQDDYSYKFITEKVDDRWAITIFVDESFYNEESEEENYFILIVNIIQDILLRMLGEKYPDIGAHLIDVESGDGSCGLLIGSISNPKTLSFFCWFYSRLCIIIYHVFGKLSEKMVNEHYNIYNLYLFAQFATVVGENIDLKDKSQSYSRYDLDLILERFVDLNKEIKDFYGYE